MIKHFRSCFLTVLEVTFNEGCVVVATGTLSSKGKASTCRMLKSPLKILIEQTMAG